MSTNNTLPEGFRASFDFCTEVSLDCPVKATTLGYYPNKGVNIFLALGFGLAAVVTIVMGVWKRTWGFSAAVAAGCILECVGYIGRVLLSTNPWNSPAFKMQIVAIILGPTLVCIGLYLTLKHAVVALARDLSRLPPRLYPLLFVPADVSCLVIQAIGGGIAAAANRENLTLLQHGNRTIMAGIVLQVVVLGFFGVLAGDYFLRVSKRFKTASAGGADADAAGAALWTDSRFRTFVRAMVAAYAALLVRCIYRIAEMAGGWGNHIMQDEPSFVVLESFMVLIACGILAGFAPGVLFPQMAHGYHGNGAEGEKRAQGAATESDSAGMEMERV